MLYLKPDDTRTCSIILLFYSENCEQTSQSFHLVHWLTWTRKRWNILKHVRFSDEVTTIAAPNSCYCWPTTYLLSRSLWMALRLLVMVAPAGCWMLDARFWSWMLDAGRWNLDPGITSKNLDLSSILKYF